MMKIKVLFLIFLLYAFSSNADEGKVIIGIIPFNYAENSYRKQAEQLQNVVTRIFNENKKISLLDRSKILIIQKELNIQKGKEYIGGKVVKQNKAYGAQYLIIGTVTNIEIEKSKFNNILSKTTNTATTYKSKLSFTLQKVDVTTGEVDDTKVFDIATNDGSNLDAGAYQKESDPMKNVITANSKKINAEVTDWVNTLFPPSLKFYGFEEKDRKGFPKYVTLVNDNESHIEQGNTISVIETVDFDFEGKARQRKIVVADLRVREIQGDIIKCAIVMGEKVIEDKIKGTNKIEFIQKI
jgi:hypothetical protein